MPENEQLAEGKSRTDPPCLLAILSCQAHVPSSAQEPFCSVVISYSFFFHIVQVRNPSECDFLSVTAEEEKNIDLKQCPRH